VRNSRFSRLGTVSTALPIRASTISYWSKTSLSSAPETYATSDRMYGSYISRAMASIPVRCDSSIFLKGGPIHG
jgi:hypothetical protein